MRGRKAGKFELKAKDRVALRELLRDGRTPLRVARRAQILLGRSERRPQVKVLGEKVERNASTVWRVCQRYLHGGLQAALYDAARPGRPPVFFQKRASAD
jgi:hypothetical protein